MNPVRSFTVLPRLPEPLKPLRELTYNLWWTWNPAAIELFRRLDLDLWRELRHNPVAMLAKLRQERLDRLARDPAYIASLERVLDSLEAYMNRTTWFEEQFPKEPIGTIAYFSAEFGLHESLPIYAGGLGILAGDHLKSASDLGLPLVGVGLLYRQGYFHQYLTNDGYQFEDYPDLDFSQLPLQAVRDDDGNQLTVSIDVGHHPVDAYIWQVTVGRVKLYLLDTNVPTNRPEDRDITARLYGGDQEMRIRQEIVLGIGGIRALSALGIHPSVCHMNEGHSAFLAVERIHEQMRQHGLSFREAREAVATGSVFTTHTPVPAGIDRFSPQLVTKYLGSYCQALGINLETLLELGRMNVADKAEPFCMAVLALRLSYLSNGVSQIHGDVSRKMFSGVYPGVPVNEVPITSITNGVHTRSWLSREVAHLFDQYLGPQWAEDPMNAAIWQRVDLIPDAELWRSHERLRERLVGFARRRVKMQLISRGAPPAEVDTADEILDPEALTIGFARRFASYKRALLLFRDQERLTRIVTDPHRPVQILIAGKAHPKDEGGKELIKRIVQFAKQPHLRNRIVFIEDYDMTVARLLVEGVDVWLNTPIKLHEASGTSGMKVTPNGGLNMSILDGWWPEGYDGTNGWAIGDRRIYGNQDYQDFMESESIYDLLEKEVIPRFYDRGSDGLPRRWIQMMKASMRTCCPMFSAHRMVREYTERFYLPAARRWNRFVEDGYKITKSVADWRHKLQEKWDEVQIEGVYAEIPKEPQVGQNLPVKAEIRLGSISPEEVSVELYYGPLDPRGAITTGASVPLKCDGSNGTPGVYKFSGALPCEYSGQYGYALRIVPHHPEMAARYNVGLVRWG
ncbi:MAG TPA: alpha-glucan family phosphorylase [Phycisphaerae bacterium]|nr:alpha-glucan family phosphorylase [Phycisphaerae bacterium]HOJ74029.1 alpha-glucan family phosphorylase [Phycisphaerae bacterium]HOM50624.1 alpha-glucan family phosphorylase [Phycisphaerae bacterium]HON67158.1 alpha-glucan family phosphorylase [Phycisphaerae bacterium]HOQ86694.1 alpha-glucan family phosphorylase [Phycisphaerae bacterium]